MLKKIFSSALILAANPAYAFHYHCDIQKIDGHRFKQAQKISLSKKGPSSLRLVIFNYEGVQDLKTLFWHDDYLKDTTDFFYFNERATRETSGSISYHYEFSLDKVTNQAEFIINNRIFKLNNCKAITDGHAHYLDEYRF